MPEFNKDFLRFLWHRKEALIWLAALLFLAFSDPYHNHYSLCPFHNLGIDFCPGCGIGRSISMLFHADVKSSFYCHPLGIPALLLIAARMARVFFRKVQHDITFNQTTPI